ncbi:MAG: enoyl-CoA hydratase-related protein, partial [Byssovorax sp.]
MSGAFTQEMTADGILVLVLDVPGEKVNTLSRGLVGEFDALLTRLETRDDVRGVVLRSGKPDGFIAGADIE